MVASKLDEGVGCCVSCETTVLSEGRWGHVPAVVLENTREKAVATLIHFQDDPLRMGVEILFIVYVCASQGYANSGMNGYPRRPSPFSGSVNFRL